MIGPLFLGLVFSIGFEGILLFQGYLYWRTYHKKDTAIYQLLVYSLCLLELFHSVITVHAGYWYLIINFGKPEQLDKLVWSLILELALTVIVSFIGRAFWISWLFALSNRNWWLTCITSIFSIAQLVLGIAEVYEGIRSPFFTTIVEGQAAIISQIVAADLGDLIISLSLCYYLHQHRSGIRKTELMLDRIIIFVVTRGFLTTGTGVLQLISYIIWPNSFIFGIFHLMASKLYTNALLATMNSRGYIASSITDTSITNDITGTSFVLSSVAANPHVNDREVFEPIEKRPNAHLSASENPAHVIISHTSSSSGVQTSSRRTHSDIDSIPTYHSSLRDIQ